MENQIYANIRKSSEYYASQHQPKPFPIELKQSYKFEDYIIQGGPGGKYRLSDVDFYVLEDGKFRKIPWK